MNFLTINYQHSVLPTPVLYTFDVFLLAHRQQRQPVRTQLLPHISVTSMGLRWDINVYIFEVSPSQWGFRDTEDPWVQAPPKMEAKSIKTGGICPRA
jgi:hypothetical protein